MHAHLSLDSDIFQNSQLGVVNEDCEGIIYRLNIYLNMERRDSSWTTCERILGLSVLDGGERTFLEAQGSHNKITESMMFVCTIIKFLQSIR